MISLVSISASSPTNLLGASLDLGLQNFFHARVRAVKSSQFRHRFRRSFFVNAERAASLEIIPRINAANRALASQVKWRLSTPTEPMELPEGRDLLTPLINRQPRWSRKMPSAQLSRALFEARRTLFEQRLASVLQDLDSREKRLETGTAVAQFLSPALLFQVALDEAAGTGKARHREFLSQLDAYVRRRDEFFTAKIPDGINVHI